MGTTLNGNPKTLASSITYLPYGGITGLTYGNGLSLSRGYDNQYRISSIVTGSIVNLTYGYDANGNITSILDTVNPPGGEIFENPGTYTYQQGTNKLTHIEGIPSIDFGYDLNADITSETGWTYVYDLSNQLIRVLQNTTQVGEYTYNGVGQRIKKVTQTETRIFHYDLRGHLIAETNQSGQMLAEYIYIGDQLLSVIKPGESVYYYHNDHLGTPQVLTNNSQAIAWKAVYTPFGETVPSIETVENPFRFPGQYYDTETGLHYNYFRYYDPQTGRYITPDPIGLEGGVNLFSYVAGNPITWVDPLGLVRGDKLYGFPKSFWQWYHRNVKRPGDPDLDLESARAYYDEWKSLGKPGPEGKVARDQCKPRGKGLRGGKGLKALGVLQFLPMLLDVYEAQKLADETGISVWTIMYYNMLGAEIVIGDDII